MRVARGLVRRARRVARGVGREAAEAAAVGFASSLGQLELLGDLLLGRLARLRRGVGVRDLAQVPVRVGVAVGVLELDELAEALGLALADDPAVVDGHDGRAAAGEDVDPAAILLRLDDERGVLALLGLLAALLDLAGVGGLGVDGEAALRQAGQRAHEVRRQATDQTRAHEHGVDVPVGVVVGEDRAADVGLGAGSAQVAGGGEDRVDRVVRVLEAVAVGVDAVLLPGGGHELHPPERAGGRDVEVAAVVGLDLVDRGQHLPAHAVLDAGGLVDGEEEGRDPELVDEEVGDADRSRARGRERVTGVRRGGGAVGALGRAGRVAAEDVLGSLRVEKVAL